MLGERERGGERRKREKGRGGKREDRTERLGTGGTDGEMGKE